MRYREFDPIAFLVALVATFAFFGISSAGENRKWIFITFGLVAIAVVVLRLLTKNRKKENERTEWEKLDVSAEKNVKFGKGLAYTAAKDIPVVQIPPDYKGKKNPVPPNTITMSDLSASSAATIYNLPPEAVSLNESQQSLPPPDPSDITSMPRFLRYGEPTSFENMPESAFSRGIVENSNTLCDALVPPEVNIPDAPVRPVINHRYDLTPAAKSAPDELVIETATPAAVKHEYRGNNAAVNDDVGGNNADDWLSY